MKKGQAYWETDFKAKQIEQLVQYQTTKAL